MKLSMSNLYKRKNATLGNNCQISDFCSLENVVIGDNVIIRDEVQLKNVIIGNNTKLARRVTLYTDDPAQPVLVGKDCVLAYGVFCEATAGQTTIGDGSSIAHNVVILSSVGPGDNNIALKDVFPEQRKPITIGKYCWIGAGSVVLPGARLQAGVVIAANSVVWGLEYSAWSSYSGNPAQRTSKRIFVPANLADKDL